MEHAESADSQDFGQYFDEGYCKVSGLDDCCELTEAVNDADSNSSHCEVDGTWYICLDTKRWSTYGCIYLLTVLSLQ
ncbi:hypothetical protein BHM03_00044879 [Ensete ventricosum]|nr:hypothetical protein BHM03_00044879 [Ensete ventricosum]